MNALARTWSGLPPIARWVALAAIVLIVYFVAVEPAVMFTSSYSAGADRIEAALKREKDLASPDSEQGRTLAEGRRFFGTPLAPTDPGARPEALYRTVDRILRGHGVDATVNERTQPSLIHAEQLVGLVEPGRSIDRFALEVTFETDPASAVAILSAVEQAPEVTAVSRVRFEKFSARAGSKDAEQSVRVSMTPELWVLADRPTPSGSAP